MADSDSWDVDNFEPPEPPKAAVVLDKWEGEDEDDDVKDNWDDEEEEGEKKEEEEMKITEKKKVTEKIKEKTRKKKDEIKKETEEPEPEPKQLTAEEQIEEKLRLKKLQEDSDLELAKEAFGLNVSGLDAMNPSTRDEFTEFGRVLKEKIVQYEKSVHYAGFLETLLRDICISLEVDDLKKVCNSMTVLCNEKQKQEKQSKAKKKKKGPLPGGGMKANMKDNLADYLDYDGEFAQEFEDFM